MNHFISLFFWRELIRESGSLERLLLLTAHNLKLQLRWRRNSLHKRHSLLTQLTQSICCCWHSMKGIFTSNDYIISNWWTDSNHLRPTPQNVWAWAIALNILICKKLVTRTTMLVKVWSLCQSNWPEKWFSLKLLQLFASVLPEEQNGGMMLLSHWVICAQLTH